MIELIKFRYLRNLSNFYGWDEVQVNDKIEYVEKFGDSLRFKQINLFVGENGSGKSSILDAIRSLKDTHLIPSIARENPPNRISPLFEVSFTEGSSISITFLAPEKGIPSSISSERSFALTVSRFPYVIKSKETLQKFPLKKEGLRFELPNSERIKFWAKDLNIPRNNCSKIFSVLNEHLHHLVGVSHYDSYCEDAESRMAYAQNNPCFSLLEDDIVQLITSDDSSAMNYIQYDYLPHGWRHLISLLSFLDNANESDICLIEEPEVHLHPKLQKLMMVLVSKYTKEKSLQIFIATHSATVINSSDNDNITLHHTKGHEISVIEGLNNDVLNELGYKASDILQANGIIWVEGPSDRVYLEVWLEEYIQQEGKPIPLEQLDFEFMYYGGAILNHYGEDKDLIKILSVNRNGIIIMDNDNHFDGTEFKNSTKERIYKRYNNSKNLYSWITEGYTIECYTNSVFFNEHFVQCPEKKVSVINSMSKVAISRKYSKNRQLGSKDIKSSNLRAHLEKMYNTIISWS